VLDITADGSRLVRVAMLPGLGQLAACIGLALILGLLLGARIPTDGEPAGMASGFRRRISASGDSHLPLYALAVVLLPYAPWLPDVLPVLRVFAVRASSWCGSSSRARSRGRCLARRPGRRLVVRVANGPAPGLPRLLCRQRAVVRRGGRRNGPVGMFPGGDEPHYLVITQSLLLDHDLRIGNNHQRQDYAAYYDDDLPPHAIAPGRDGETYSVHPIGLPILAAPAFAAAGYPGVVMLMVLLAAAAAALAWAWVRRVTGSVSAATFSWSAVALSVPYLASSGTIYPEIPAALAVMVAASVAIRDAGLGDTTGEARKAPAVPGARCCWDCRLECCRGCTRSTPCSPPRCS